MKKAFMSMIGAGIVVFGVAGVAKATPVITDGLVAAYEFNGNADDLINGNHGVVHGATLTTGRFGITNSAYSFDGNGDYIDLGNPSIFDFGTGNFSINIWANSSANSSKILVGEWGGAEGDSGNWEIHTFPNGNISFAFDNPYVVNTHTHLLAGHNYTVGK